MARVKILADSTSDLTSDLIKRYNIGIVPLYITLDSDSLMDGIQAHPRDLYEYFDRTKKPPKTSAPTIGDFVAIFEPLVKAGDEIVFIGISEAMSTTLNSARTAAAEFPGHPIYCVNSQSLSSGIGELVLAACDLANEGRSAAEIAKALTDVIPRVRASFVLDTLTYLYYGGRCSAVQNISAMLLKIKPRIDVIHGELSPTEKYRGGYVSVARQYAQSVLANAVGRIDPKRVFLTSTLDTDPAALDAVREEITNLHYFDEVIENQAGCVITSHCGQNTLGVLFIDKP
ncbi:degV domain-containing protein [Clostridia bacterium]|nr:degV domain-containing protein [Clostridia bacterium]